MDVLLREVDRADHYLVQRCAVRLIVTFKGSSTTSVDVYVDGDEVDVRSSVRMTVLMVKISSDNVVHSVQTRQR